MENEFKIRAMSKSELARLYSPNVKPKSASRNLRNWIKKCKELKKDLRRTKYKRDCKMLTYKQVEMIVNHLGPP